MDKLSNLIIKRILQFCIKGKYDISEYDSYNPDHLSSVYSMKFKDNNVDVIVKLSLVCKLWAEKIVPYLDYPFYQVVGGPDDPLIPSISKFGISNQLAQFNNRIELERLSILISDSHHNNIQARADSDSLAILGCQHLQANQRGYVPMLYNLFFLSFGFDVYFNLVIKSVNPSSYFFQKLQHITVTIQTQSEMSALRHCLFQLPSIKSLNAIIAKTTNSVNTSNIITIGLAKSIEIHPSLERLSLSSGNFNMPINCKNKFKHLKLKDIVVNNLYEINGNGITNISNSNTNNNNSGNNSPPHPPTTSITSSTSSQNNIMITSSYSFTILPTTNQQQHVNTSLSNLIENNLKTLTRITLRDFKIEGDLIPKVAPNSFFDPDPAEVLDNSMREIINIFRILSTSEVLEYLDIKTMDIPYQSIRDLIVGCKSLKTLHIKLTHPQLSKQQLPQPQISPQQQLNSITFNNNNNNNNNNSFDIIDIENNEPINLIDYSFIGMPNSPLPIIPISQSIKYMNVPKLNTQIIMSPIILQNLVSIVHDGFQTKDFKYLISLIKNTKTLEKLVIKSVKSNKQINNKNNNNNNNNNNLINDKLQNEFDNRLSMNDDWVELFKSINNNCTLTTLHLLECPSLKSEIVDDFIKSQHPTIINVKLHKVDFKISSLYVNRSFENVNIIITCDDLSQLIIKNSTIKQLKCNIFLSDFLTPSSSVEFLAKSLKATKISSIQVNRTLMLWSPNLLKYLKNFSYPI
ncbi:hypothetical protein ACTFIU_007487 [Dictyostelium citrinum]